MSPKVHLSHLNCHRFSTSLTTFNLHFNIPVKLIHLNNTADTSRSVERYILPTMKFKHFCTTKSGVDDT